MTGAPVILNAPVRSLEMLELQLAAGANEIYLGLPAPELNIQTFNARAKSSDGFPCQVSSIRGMKTLVAEAHASGMRVGFSANARYLPSSLHPAYVDQVKQAIELGVDSVIIGNLSLARLLRDQKVEVPLTAGLFLNVGTARFAAYLRDQLEITRIVVPHAMKLAELKTLCELRGLSIEVPAHTGAGAACGRCTIYDSASQPELGLGCRAGYDLHTPDGQVLRAASFLDGAGDCSLCSVADLLDVGVSAFKIPGRESPNVRQNAKLTQMYRKLIHDSIARKPIAQSVKEIDRVELMWQMRWVPRFCDRQRCKFKSTPITDSYV